MVERRGGKPGDPEGRMPEDEDLPPEAKEEQETDPEPAGPPPRETDETEGGKGEGRKTDAGRPADDQRGRPDPKEKGPRGG